MQPSLRWGRAHSLYRWNVAIKADFAKVGELVRYGRAFMEVSAIYYFIPCGEW